VNAPVSSPPAKPGRLDEIIQDLAVVFGRAPSQTDTLLAARETAGLRWSIHARLVFLCVAPILIAFLRQGRPELAIVLPLMGLGILASIFALRQIKKPGANSARIGLYMSIFDLTAIVAMPLVWYFLIGEQKYSPAFLMKGEVTALGFVLLIISTLTLRPLFPALVTIKVVTLHLIILLLAALDERTIFTDDVMASLNDSSVSIVVFMNRVIILLFTGLALTGLARSARRALREAVDLERENFRIQDDQARHIMEARIDSLGNLVAGIAHEMNSPLGVLSSSASTIASCADKFGDENPQKREKAAALIGPAVGSVKEATARINGLVTSLRNFAHLDEAEVQKVSVESLIEEAMSLIPERMKGKVDIQTQLKKTSDIHARPSELNQVFHTLIRNAFEALDGQGKLSVKTHEQEGKVIAEIEDTGPGMDEDRVEQIFDVNFSQKKSGRIGVGWGLPSARRIIERHFGSIEVKSEPGKGTRFTIKLPIQRGEVTSTSPLNT
jgi:signal transduction histidine kinase